MRHESSITYLRLPQVQVRVGLSRSSVWKRCAESSKRNKLAGTLPPPVPLGGRAIGWPQHEIDAINAARAAGKSDDEIRELVKQLVAERGAPEKVAA